MSSPRFASTSKAYWELRAEQVMDRVFVNAGRNAPAEEPDTIEVEVRDATTTASPAPASAAPASRNPASSKASTIWQQLATPLSIALAISLSGLGVGGAVVLWHGSHQARQDLQQERNLRLLQGLRTLEAPAPPSQEQTLATPTAEAAPPAAPQNPWIEELEPLGGSAAPLKPLQVPLNGTLQVPPAGPSAAVPTTPTPAPAGPAIKAPELLGVVQIPGQPGSAIFQSDGSSSSTSVGDTIGSTDWRLISISGDSAVIERGGSRRHVSISSGF
jgi:hypothetical protein